MNEGEMLDSILKSGGGAGVVIALTIFGRKMWRTVVEEWLATKKDNAEGSVIDLLREELERTREEITNLKSEIKSLDNKVDKLKEANSALRYKALETLSVLSTVKGDNQGVAKLRAMLMAIVSQTTQ